MKTSEQINELASALAKAQGQFSNPERNRTVKVQTKTGGSYTFDYATLDSILSMVRPLLAANGLSIVQPVSIEADWVVVTTRLIHASGQWIEESLPMKPAGFSPQEIGSASTYGKRYGLTSILSIASEEDDDGNHASGNHATATPRQTSNRQAQAPAFDKPHNQSDLQAVMRPSTLFEEHAKWLQEQEAAKVIPSIEDGWKATYTAAHSLSHTQQSLRLCTNAGTFQVIRDKILGKPTKQPTQTIMGTKTRQAQPAAVGEETFPF